MALKSAGKWRCWRLLWRVVASATAAIAVKCNYLTTGDNGSFKSMFERFRTALEIIVNGDGQR